MNRGERIMEAMSYVDLELAEQAAEETAGGRQGRPRGILAVTACLCILLGASAAAAHIFPRLTVVEKYSVARSEDDIISLYAIQHAIVRLPLDQISDQARELAAAQMRLPVIKDCANWTEAEAFLGVELADNSLLDPLEPSESSVWHYEKSLYRCGVTFKGKCAAPSFIDVDVTYQVDENWNSAAEKADGPDGATTISVHAEIFTDEALEVAVERTENHISRGPEPFVLENYVTPNGLETIIAKKTAYIGNDPLRDTITSYQAHFALNGVPFQVLACNYSEPDRALEVLKQVLDAYE